MCRKGLTGFRQQCALSQHFEGFNPRSAAAKYWRESECGRRHQVETIIFFMARLVELAARVQLLALFAVGACPALVGGGEGVLMSQPVS